MDVVVNGMNESSGSSLESRSRDNKIFKTFFSNSKGCVKGVALNRPINRPI